MKHRPPCEVLRVLGQENQINNPLTDAWLPVRGFCFDLYGHISVGVNDVIGNGTGDGAAVGRALDLYRGVALILLSASRKRDEDER